MSDKLTPRSKDYSRWYTEIVQRSGLADYAPVRGCMVIMPYGFALWENIRDGLDRRFKATGHVNAYFPLFIPMSLLQREAKHIEGFSPELAVVTHGGGKELEEPLAVRPTSETIIGSMYARWIQSYRDLPVLINQWANVVRWEKRPRLFLRTSEFLWQEGHTAHATQEEAEEEALRMLNVYADFAENEAAIPVLKGRKSASEKFAGAIASYSIEAMMGNRWALQAGTSHFLGQNFARAFDITFLDENNTRQYCWTTSWGVSTRMLGAVIMTHGDDHGLILPPRIAPIQAIIVPIWTDDAQKSSVLENVDRIQKKLAGVRFKVDAREEYSPGWKFNQWEMKGVPLRVEIGPREVQSDQAILARRDVFGQVGKTAVPQAGIAVSVTALLDEIQQALYDRALRFREENTREVTSYGDLRAAVEDQFALAYWCGAPEDEARLKEDTKATSRCFPLDQTYEPDICAICGRKATEKAVFARAY
jgi:prolyl-tRNA synthetase